MATKTAKTETGVKPALDLDSEETIVEIEKPSAGAAESGGSAGKRPAEAPNPEPPAPVAQRQGDDSRPFCGKHNCLMKATSSTKETTRYACPVPLCDQKEKRARGTVKIPREPQACPDVRCRGKKTFLEVDAPRSTMAHLSMVCPSCAFEIKVPRPMYNAGVRTFEQEGDLAAR